MMLISYNYTKSVAKLLKNLVLFYRRHIFNILHYVFYLFFFAKEYLSQLLQPAEKYYPYQTQNTKRHTQMHNFCEYY